MTVKIRRIGRGGVEGWFQIRRDVLTLRYKRTEAQRKWKFVRVRQDGHVGQDFFCGAWVGLGYSPRGGVQTLLRTHAKNGILLCIHGSP